ncbi:MAG: hypothetical protein KKA73_10935 [Chloroflexi bacterium]|nr:hypothetical protein [Chloroflexota bacterium]MBU1748191.1 hypothetical protein [Chloroflexota bacterium]MBU1880240.1 hypothetical protein [Chloroflexota bacterium]
MSIAELLALTDRVSQLRDKLPRTDWPPLDRATELAALRSQIRDALVVQSDATGAAQSQLPRQVSATRCAELGQALGLTAPALADVLRGLDFDETGYAPVTSRDLDRLSLAYLAAVTGWRVRRLQQILELTRLAALPASIDLTDSHLRLMARVSPDDQPLLAVAITAHELNRRETAAVVTRMQRGETCRQAVTALLAQRPPARAPRPAATADTGQRMLRNTAHMKDLVGSLSQLLDDPTMRFSPAALDAAGQQLALVLADLKQLERQLWAMAIWQRHKPAGS